jgi:hypothetical protein
MLGAPVVNVFIPAKAGIHRLSPCYFINRGQVIPSTGPDVLDCEVYLPQNSGSREPSDGRDRNDFAQST